MKKFTKIMLIVVIILAVILVGLIALTSGGDDGSSETSSSPAASDTAQSEDKATDDSEIKLLHGEFLELKGTDEVAVVKAKIKSNYNNESTVSQNYYNVVDLIQNQGFEKYEEIQYWAVSDMNDGSEQKVVSFTISKETIDLIAKGNFPANQLGNYTTELWVHPSLEK